MDTARGRLEADRVDRAAHRISRLRERSGEAVRSAHWRGPDAEELRSRWEALSRGPLAVLGARLHVLATVLRAEAAAQERASAADERLAPPSRLLGPALAPAAPPPARHPAPERGADPPVAGPLPSSRTDLAALVSDGIGGGLLHGLGGLEAVVAGLGGDVDGIGQVRQELVHLGGLLEGWADGEHVPTVAELGASVLLLSGAIAIAPVETMTDTGVLDPRTEVAVHGIVQAPAGPAPRSLADLLAANDEARRPLAGVPGEAVRDGVASGRVRIQTVRGEDGVESFIVHAPPTGGAPLWDADSWGAQGNSAGWDSNLRTMAGQESAAMADIRAAMAAAQVPSGARVMFVGHSQGGLTAAHLAADPAFNRTDGAPGSYDVTHSFSVGSPVGTVVPAQGSTRVVDVSHTPADGVPLLLRPAASWPVPPRIADPVPLLDLAGYRVDGSRVSSPAVVEVGLEAPTPTYAGSSALENAHESVLRSGHGVDPTGGYHGSLREATGSDPDLSALQADLEGRYLGDGVVLVEDVVVDVGREDLR